MTVEPDPNQPPPAAPVAAERPMARPTRAPLEGERVRLRPLDPVADARALHAASHGDPETEALWTYMPYGPFSGPGVMKAWLEDCAGADEPDFRTVVDRDADRPVGMAAFLNIETAHFRLELGHIWYCPAVQGGRVNSETVLLMLREAFDRLGARRVEWKCDALNARSRAAALRLGFRFEGVLRQHMIVKGRNRDTAGYALVDADWPAARANLERWLYGGETGLSLTELNAPPVAGCHDPAAHGPG